MGGLFETGSGFSILKKWTSSSRPKTSPFDNLVNRGKGMAKAERAAFLKREAAKESVGNGLQANTPLTSRYA